MAAGLLFAALALTLGEGAYRLHNAEAKSREGAEAELGAFAERKPDLTFGRPEIPGHSERLPGLPEPWALLADPITGRIIRIPVANARGAGEAKDVHARLTFMPDESGRDMWAPTHPIRGEWDTQNGPADSVTLPGNGGSAYLSAVVLVDGDYPQGAAWTEQSRRVGMEGYFVKARPFRIQIEIMGSGPGAAAPYLSDTLEVECDYGRLIRADWLGPSRDPNHGTTVEQWGWGITLTPFESLCGRSVNQLLQRQRLLLNDRQHGVSEEVGVVAVVELEGDLIEVGGQMLGAHLVVGADHRPLQEAPHALHGVRMDDSPNPLALVVGHELMARVGVLNAAVCLPSVRVDRFGVVAHNVLDEGVKLSLAGPIPDLETDLTAALNGSQDHRLAGAATGATLGALAAPPHAAHVGLVNLHDAAQRHRRVLFHRCADAVREIPRRLVGHVQRALKLAGAHPLLGLAHEVDRHEPLGQRQMRVLKDRPDRHGELVAA